MSFLAANAKRETQLITWFYVTDGLSHFAKKTFSHSLFSSVINSVFHFPYISSVSISVKLI